ncbi:MAG: exodeoxyribonuclease VII small subunit [Bacteroidetes bacterium]|nr:MAG: exodeoxyribonuclease VII small subunit [Bacteroidota bacterium]
MKKKLPTTYEAALNELQQILTELQSGSARIDELGTRVQRAAELIAFCRQKLRDTEAQVENLFPPT